MYEGIFKKKVRFILMLFLFSCIIPLLFCHGKQGKENKYLIKDILSVHQSKGETGLRDFVNKRRNQITAEFILDFLETGLKDRKEEWFRIIEIIAEERNDKKILANVYLKMGNYFRLTQENKKHLDLVELGKAYHRKENIFSHPVNQYKAWTLYGKAMLLFTTAADPIGKGNVYWGMGELYLRESQYIEAFKVLDNALVHYENSNHLPGQGEVYIRKGDIYAKYGYYPKAKEMYNIALAIFEKIREPLKIGALYFKKGEISIDEGDKPAAFELFNKALLFYEKVGNYNEQDNGNMFRHKGKIFFYTDNPSAALEMYDNALLSFEKRRNAEGQAYVYRDKGDVYFSTRDYSRALDLYQKAYSFYESGFGYMDEKFYTLYRKAKTLKKLGKRMDALFIFDSAFSELKQFQYWAPLYKMKKTFQKKISDQYEDAIIFMLENGYYDNAFEWIEYFRTMLFRDRQTEVLGNLDELISPEFKKSLDKFARDFSSLSKKLHKSDVRESDKELKEQYDRLEDDLEDLQFKIWRVYLGADLTPELKKSRDDALEAASQYIKGSQRKFSENEESKKKDFNERYGRFEHMFKNALNKLNPVNHFYGKRLQPLVSLRAMQRHTLKKGETLLNYFILKDKFYAFIITKEHAEALPLEVKKDEINSKVNRFIEAMIARDSTYISIFGKLLYEQLFKPLEERLKENRNIILIPGSYLARVPFESLIIGEEKSGRTIYLLEKYGVKYIQSASIISELRDPLLEKRETKGFVGIGDPVYENENFKQEKSASDTIMGPPQKRSRMKELNRSRYILAGGSIKRIPESGKEIMAIARIFQKQSQKCVVYCRAEALEKKTKSADMKGFGYIHFACHGILGEYFQSLLLSQFPQEQSIEDGYFTLEEIMNCQYNAQLVVLSACKSGSGKLKKGESVAGMARAFMYTGIPAVVASLWKAEDEAAKELMVSFYKNMLEKNLEKSEALRQAKLEMIKNKKYESPFFWSAFVMYGE